MDSTSYAVTVTSITTSVSKEVWQALPPLLWFILYAGWLAYWGKKLSEVNASNKALPIIQILKIYWKDNWVEIPSSALACLILALITDLPPSVMGDKMVMGFVFALGYSSSSVLNFESFNLFNASIA